MRSTGAFSSGICCWLVRVNTVVSQINFGIDKAGDNKLENILFLDQSILPGSSERVSNAVGSDKNKDSPEESYGLRREGSKVSFVS